MSDWSNLETRPLMKRDLRRMFARERLARMKKKIKLDYKPLRVVCHPGMYEEMRMAVAGQRKTEVKA
jgi:hypothetical protein